MKLRRSALACTAASIVLVFAATGRASISGIDAGLGDFGGGGLLGDTPDGMVNHLDIDLLAVAAHAWALNPSDPLFDFDLFDLNNDNMVTFAIGAGGSLDDNDSDVLIRDILETQYGDANLDGTVFLDDIITLAQNWRETGPLFGWADGNFDGSQETGTTPPRIYLGDVIALATSWRFTDTDGDAVRVFDVDGNGGIEMSHNPEPVSWHVWIVGMLCAYCLKQRRAKRFDSMSTLS